MERGHAQLAATATLTDAATPHTATVNTTAMSEKLTKSEQRERRLNLACTEAKAAAKAAPDDAALAAAYVKAKAAFKKHQQRREQRAEKSAAAAAPAPAASDSWTCAVCGITISIADPRAKEQHLAGKAHAKKAKAAGAPEPALFATAEAIQLPSRSNSVSHIYE